MTNSASPPAGYDAREFPAFAVTVDIVVFTMSDGVLQVVLVRRGEAPFQGRWAIPGGFKRPDEMLDEAARRELQEETGVDGAILLAPFGANAAGWIFTEMGRQPFVVAPNPDLNGIDQVFMFTAAAVSPGVSAGELLTSLVVLTAVYALLLVVEVRLLVKYIRGGIVSAMPELAHAPEDENEDATPGKGGPDAGKPADDVLAFAY